MADFLRIRKDFCGNGKQGDIVPDEFRFGDELIRIADIQHVYLDMSNQKAIVYELIDGFDLYETFESRPAAISRLNQLEKILNKEV